MSGKLVLRNLLGSSDERTLRPNVDKEPSKQPATTLEFLRRIRGGGHRAVRLIDWAAERRRRRRAIMFGALLLALFGVGVVVGWHKRVTLKRNATVAATRDHARYAIAQAGKLSEVEPGRAYQLLSQEIDRLDGQLTQSTDRVEKQSLAELKDDVKRTRDVAAKVTTVRPEAYLDFSLVRSGARGLAMSAFDDTLSVLDPWSPAIFSASATRRAASVIGGGEAFRDARAITGGSRAAYILTKDSIVKVDTQTLAARTVINDEEGVWNDATDLALFDENLYVFDHGMSELYKYSHTPDGFGARRRWFRQGVIPDLSDAVDLAISGSVWFLHRDGAIDKFEQGGRTSFRLQWSETITDPVKLSVPPGGKRLWVLDRGKKRIVAFDRESGAYLGQWVSDMLQDTQDFVVNEDLRKAFLLVGEKIYTFEVS